jgi:hypothetical protein
MLDLEHLNDPPLQLVHWPASNESVQNCIIRGQPPHLCRNYVKVLLPLPTTAQQATAGNLAIEEDDEDDESAEPTFNELDLIDEMSIDRLLICATNAFKPICSWRRVGGDQQLSTIERIQSGQLKCPYSPLYNFTALISSQGRQLFFF